jgi:glycerophosphoryl diester phosphodiesterase
MFPVPVPVVTRRPTSVVAHGGTDGSTAENTIEGCRRAIAAGADGVEVDLCVTRDRRVVLWHDREPDDVVAIARQTGLAGGAWVPAVPAAGSELRRPVSELAWQELSSSHGYDPAAAVLENVIGLEDGRHVAIDTLESFFAWAADEPRARSLVLDIKLAPHERELVDPLLDGIDHALAVHPGLASRRLHMLVPQREVLLELRERLQSRSDLAGITVAADFELPGAVETAQALGIRHVSIGINPRRTWPSVRSDIVEAVSAREAGELDTVTVWTADDEDHLETLARLQIDYVLTDAIELAASVLRAR